MRTWEKSHIVPQTLQNEGLSVVNDGKTPREIEKLVKIAGELEKHNPFALGG
jgi:hypothetical protein